MNIQEVMTREPVTCTAADSLNEAARWLWEKDCGCLPVVDDQRRVIGMVTDRDICMAAYTRGLPLSALTVADAMSKHLVSCQVTDSLADATRSMAEAQVRRLPVVDAAGRILGLLSLNDIARAPDILTQSEQRSLRERVAETLAMIGERRKVLEVVEKVPLPPRLPATHHARPGVKPTPVATG